jgi:hypothetical protein
MEGVAGPVVQGVVLDTAVLEGGAVHQAGCTAELAVQVPCGDCIGLQGVEAAINKSLLGG